MLHVIAALWALFFGGFVFAWGWNAWHNRGHSSRGQDGPPTLPLPPGTSCYYCIFHRSPGAYYKGCEACAKRRRKYDEELRRYLRAVDDYRQQHQANV